MQVTLFVLFAYLFLPAINAASPLITSFTPAAATPGETLVIQGSGFNGTTHVFLQSFRQELVAATFTAVSNTELHVTVPRIRTQSFDNYMVRITIISESGGTVTLPPDIQIVERGQSVVASGSRGYLVRNGGALATGGAGGVFMYLERGAAADVTGGAIGHRVYMETESVVNLPSGNNGAGVFREGGAVIRIGGVPNDPATSTPWFFNLPALRPSHVSALLRVLPVPVITSSAVASGKVGEPFTYTITTEEMSSSGGQFAATGLPAGLTLGTSSGMISGTPQVAGTYEITLSATNLNGTGTKVLTLKIGTSLSPSFTGPRVLLAKSTEPFSHTLTASNGPERFGATGLPEGVTLDPLTGAISGTPSAAGIYQVAVTATNPEGVGSATILLLVDRVQPRVTGFSQPSAVRGDHVRVNGTGLEGTTHVYLSDFRFGVVPVPFTVSSQSEIEVEIPQVETRPNSNYEARMVVVTPAGATVTVPPSFQEVRTSIIPGSQVFYMVRNGGSLAGGPAGSVVAYLESGSVAQASSGNGNSYFVEAGAIASVGTSFGHTVVHAADARISGTPARLIGAASLVPSFPSALLRVLPTPRITSSLTAAPIVGRSFNYQITESGLRYEASGLPPGLSVNSGTGLISGVPREMGQFVVQLSVFNGNGAGRATATFTVSEPQIPVIATRGNFVPKVDQAFSLQVAATYSPTLFEAVGLPPGLQIDPVSGLITGAVTAEGVYSIGLRATNPNGTGTAIISMLVGRKAPRITSLPEAAVLGEVIEVHGEGFNQTSAVYFDGLSHALSHPLAAEYQVQSDTLLRVTVPPVRTNPVADHRVRIRVVTPAGATVTVPPDFTDVTGTTAVSSSQKFHVVQSGATLTSSSGGALVAYLKVGASAVISGGVGHTFFVEGGASLALSGTTASVIYGSGADVTGTVSSPLAVPVVTPSYVAKALRIRPLPVLTSPKDASASLGLPFIYSTQATNSPTSFEATGLPVGTTIDASNGIISGRVKGHEATYPVLLKLTNAEGDSTFTLTLQVRDDYKKWKDGKFASLEDGAANPKAHDTADPDGDGIPNILEFSAGNDPLLKEPGAYPLQPVIVNGNVRFRYRRLKGAGEGSTEEGYTLGTIRYKLLASEDLLEWQTGTNYFSEVGSPVDNGDGTETVTVRLTSSNSQFVKLEVSHREP